MKFEALEIPDVKVLYPKQFGDERGFFSETYSQNAFSAAGIEEVFVQDNHSLSRDTGVLRGLHYQCPPFAQDKLVRVVRGRILDVAVDIRAHSKTFGKWVAAEISAKKWNQIFVPKGFAHGFVTLEPDTEVTYKVSAPYAPETERSIKWNDIDLAIKWPFDASEVTLSAKDAEAMTFAEYRNDPAF
ncbi:dTDP-4-dehydrorhamnose 3,5-epimerase [Thalassospira sp. MCCC 1A02491]|uniref:dTDP-4-dehydrorhamnose 3,5-epimerase n=1 Tax=Thalassospira sp. MCCC 1A02491 TaxID=1769751 RepID=UPI0007AD72FA|nr:dTDP-4-dehydrorhamnose 3,5-epimerase [Thalassospira sp. MCCC 1A02491]KZB62720.1 dTDP-4-dehydrorhamnose 3,5-epimerase [Thalassospira sp. MCCC 1A02491]